MDILQRKLLNEGDSCFFLRASVDEPYIYLRFCGEIMRRYTSNDLVMYHVKITNVLEEKHTIRKYLNRKRFRVFDSSNSRTTNKPFYTYDIIDDVDFQLKFSTRYKNAHLDVHSMLVYPDVSDMNTYRNTAIDHLISKLSMTLSELNLQKDGDNR